MAYSAWKSVDLNKIDNNRVQRVSTDNKTAIQTSVMKVKLYALEYFAFESWDTSLLKLRFSVVAQPAFRSKEKNWSYFHMRSLFFL